jgi:YD repeat-containing protein
VTRPSVLRVTINPVLPKVLVELTPSFPDVPGSTVLVHVAASSLAPIVGLILQIAGQPVGLDSQGRASYTPSAPGRYGIAATATDADGLVGKFSTVLKVRDPNDQVPPGVALAPTLQNAKLTQLTNIVGTVSETNLDSWTLELAPAGSDSFTPLASGNTPVAGGVLAQLDPNALANGSYQLRLTAVDISGRVSSVLDMVDISTTTKPDQYLTSVTDLTVPLGGATVNLVRQYDSLAQDQSGTFGYGWRLANRDTNIQTSVPATGLEAQGIYNPFRIGTRVFITLPDGSRAGFTFAPLAHQQSGVTYYTPAWQADPGVAYHLASADAVLTLAVDHLYDLRTAHPYNPASGDFGAREYTLTGPDGTVYYLSTRHGVQEEIRPGGAHLIFSDGGITAATGESIQFVHDAQGRLTSITAPDGTGVVYTYDSAGNLVAARNLSTGQPSRYGYLSGSVHLLTEVVSPSGGKSAVIRYTPTLQVFPLTADLGSSGQFLASDRGGALAAGGTDRYAFSLQPSEIRSTASEALYLGISVQAAAGSALQPAIPSIAGLTPLVSRVSTQGAFALYAISRDGLELLELSGANGATSGGYTLHLFVAGDVNGDGKVDGYDGQLLAAALGTSVGQSGYLAGADANQDGVIDATDAQLLSSDLGFQANQPPVVTAGQALTHQDLAVSVDLATLATDPEDDRVYFRLLNPQHGSATLSPDGHTVTFIPAPGDTGLATFQYVADDGYGTSAPATVSVNVSAAPLINLDVAQRAELVGPGEALNLTVTGDFADQPGVDLPTSYVTVTSTDTQVATT